MSDLPEQKMSDGTILEPSVCPACGYEFDCATDAYSEHRPQHGDLSVCAKCGALGQFERAGTIRPVTAKELANLHPDTAIELKRLQTLIREKKPLG
jgi:hypothetical protein